MHYLIVAIFGPVISYLLFAVQEYLNRHSSKSPDYLHLPKYRFLVWKIHRVLIGLIPYYVDLSKEGKLKFISRLIVLLQNKVVMTREGEVDTLEKRIIIFAALVQLTFGLRRFTLPHFRGVILYPQRFFSKLINRDVLGLTSRKGVVALSWYDTVKGIHDTTDNLHLALHEWAHALLLDYDMDHTSWIYRTVNAQRRHAEAYFETEKDKENRTTYLRDYAFTNEHEFFAVCVEHFFETPATFASELEELYSIFCSLLNQNPLNTKTDYQL